MKKIGLFFIFCALILGGWYFKNRSNLSLMVEETRSHPSQTDINLQKVDSNNLSSSNSPIDKVKDEVFHQPVLVKPVPNNFSKSFIKQERLPSSIENYFSNESIKTNDRNYLVSKTLRSISSRQFKEDFGNVVAIKSGYTFFEDPSQSYGLPTLYNSSQHQVVLLTGRVLLKNILRDEAQVLASKFNASLDFSMEHLNIFAIDLGNEVLNNLSSFNNVESELELIEGGVHEK